MRTALSLLLALFLASGPVAAQPATSLSMDDLAGVIDATLDDSTYTGTHWGVQVVNLRTGQVLYARNAEKGFVPASNVKLFTSAGALDRLGPDFRYTTEVYVDGPIEGGTLQGNLIIRGSGDPSIGGHEQRNDVTRVFRAWADSLRALGIRHIAGDVIGDDAVFDDESLGTGWAWDDTAYGYAAQVGGLSFNLNTIDLRLRGQQPGMPGTLSWTPVNTSYVTVVNRSKTIAAWERTDEDYVRRPGTNEIHVRTRVPAGDLEREDLTVDNPTRFFTHVLREVLLDEGLSIDGAPRDADVLSIRPAYADEGLRRVAIHRSPPMAELAATLNAESLNLYAEHVLRTLGVETAPDSTGLPPGSAALGARTLKETLFQAQIDTSRVQIVDGSGLSRQNILSPQATVQLLTYMWTHPDATISTAFYESLPIGGENGTLEYRFRGRAPAHGNVRAKTGTLSNTSALSGYVSTGRGTPLAFSIYSNNFVGKTRFLRAAQDDIVNALARLGM